MSLNNTCPSTLEGSVCAMLVLKEQICANRKRAEDGGQVDKLLAACWEKTIEPGPYDIGR
ncbi:MAG: hypothetical protein JW797_04275 [Bradymonadales bacterium]|nr:hypothetical protein [Bradymonadales bacterium]